MGCCITGLKKLVKIKLYIRHIAFYQIVIHMSLRKAIKKLIIIQIIPIILVILFLACLLPFLIPGKLNSIEWGEWKMAGEGYQIIALIWFTVISIITIGLIKVLKPKVSEVKYEVKYIPPISEYKPKHETDIQKSEIENLKKNIKIDKAIIIISERKGWFTSYYQHPGLEIKISNEYHKDIKINKLRWDILIAEQNMDNNANIEEKIIILPAKSHYIYESPTKLSSNNIHLDTKMILRCFIIHKDFESSSIEIPINFFGLLDKSKKDFWRFGT